MATLWLSAIDRQVELYTAMFTDCEVIISSASNATCYTCSPSPPGLPSQPTLLPHQRVWSPLLHHWRYSWDRSGSSSGDTVCSAGVCVWGGGHVQWRFV